MGAEQHGAYRRGRHQQKRADANALDLEKLIRAANAGLKEDEIYPIETPRENPLAFVIGVLETRAGDMVHNFQRGSRIRNPQQTLYDFTLQFKQTANVAMGAAKIKVHNSSQEAEQWRKRIMQSFDLKYSQVDDFMKLHGYIPLNASLSSELILEQLRERVAKMHEYYGPRKKPGTRRTRKMGSPMENTG